MSNLPQLNPAQYPYFTKCLTAYRQDGKIGMANYIRSLSNEEQNAFRFEYMQMLNDAMNLAIASVIVDILSGDLKL